MTTYDWLETLEGPTAEELEAIEEEAARLSSVYEF
jgi:hypothetical protein